MIYYVILFVIIIAFYIFQDKKKYCYFVSVVLVSFAGLRANTIGPDTLMYQYIYEDVASHSLLFLKAVRGDMENAYEIGYLYLQYCISRFFPYNVFKFICSAISVLPAFYVIYRYSKNVCLSFVIFYTLPIYTTVSMSMMRQGCAFGICMIAYIFFVKHKLFLFFMLVFIATLFHHSALFFLPIYLINFIKLKHSYFKYIILVLGLIYINSRFLFQYLNQYSRIHYTEGAAGGLGMLFFMLLLLFSVFCFVEKTKIENTEIKTQIYLLVYTIGLWFIGMHLAAVFRLAAYTEFFICLYVSNVLCHIRNVNLRYILQLVSVILSVVAMNNIVIYNKGLTYGYYPFYFIWE